MRKIYLMAGQTVVEEHRLADLERRAALHDSYVRATKLMAGAQSQHVALRKQARRDGKAGHDQNLYSMGWLDSLHAFNDAVLNAMEEESRE